MSYLNVPTKPLDGCGQQTKNVSTFEGTAGRWAKAREALEMARIALATAMQTFTEADTEERKAWNALYEMAQRPEEAMVAGAGKLSAGAGFGPMAGPAGVESGR